MHEHISLGLSRRPGRVPLAEIFRVDASSILSAAARDTCLHRSSRNGEDAIKLKIQTSSVRLCAADDVGCGITRGVVRRRSREKSCGPTSLQESRMRNQVDSYMSDLHILVRRVLWASRGFSKVCIAVCTCIVASIGLAQYNLYDTSL